MFLFLYVIQLQFLFHHKNLIKNNQILTNIYSHSQTLINLCRVIILFFHKFLKQCMVCKSINHLKSLFFINLFYQFVHYFEILIKFLDLYIFHQFQYLEIFDLILCKVTTLLIIIIYQLNHLNSSFKSLNFNKL